MVRQALADLRARQRLLDGFVRRLARDADAEAFALRGGMLVRHWFPDSRRPARDVDLVCASPFDRAAMRDRFARILARSAGDGVAFEADRFRLDAIHTKSAHPGMRLFAVGRAEGDFAEIHVDVTFRMPVWPQARRDALAGGEAAIWHCPPEMLVGRKLQVLAQLGPYHWRPKDLGDTWLLLRRFDLPTSLLGEAIERSFAGHDHPGVAELLRQSWWSEPRAAMRWGRYASGLRRAAMPEKPATLAHDLLVALRPFASAPFTPSAIPAP